MNKRANHLHEIKISFIVVKIRKVRSLASVPMVWLEILLNPAANNQETVLRISIVQILLLVSITGVPILATYHRVEFHAEGTLNVSFTTTCHFADVLIKPLAIQQ